MTQKIVTWVDKLVQLLRRWKFASCLYSRKINVSFVVTERNITYIPNSNYIGINLLR